jgi:hypothetical protein
VQSAPRYLDALLRDNSTPWAIEMKVQGSAGVRSYYRHAIGQAVLYRHFIRSAAPLNFWFTERHLNREACKTAVLIPELEQQLWAERLSRLCELLDVELIQVPHRFANLP